LLGLFRGFKLILEELHQVGSGEGLNGFRQLGHDVGDVAGDPGGTLAATAAAIVHDDDLLGLAQGAGDGGCDFR
jgi:hypothetical protein